jgi:hypothetical protein
MKSRSKQGSKRRYFTARDVLADILPPAIARKLKVNPRLSNAKPRTVVAQVAAAKRRSDALGSFLDNWEAKHGDITLEELARAASDLTVHRGQSDRGQAAGFPQCRTGACSWTWPIYAPMVKGA